MDYLFWVGGVIFCGLFITVLILMLKQIIKERKYSLPVEIIISVMSISVVMAFFGLASVAISHFLRVILPFI